MNTKLTIEYNSEKLKALIKFSEKKGINIQEELISVLDKLYVKNVPTPVREFIEE